jgi:SAM-dependent methyltransferase
MKLLDRVLQRWRAGIAADWVPSGARLLDVGCADGLLLRQLAPRLSRAVGVDPHAERSVSSGVEILPGRFPGEPRFAAESFDCVTLLAVLEHVLEPEVLASECYRVLSPGGRVVLTVPHPFVDRILELSMRVGLLDGMGAEEHHGFDPSATGGLFEDAGFLTLVDRRFQLGLNRLFVFERPGAGARS